MFLTIDKFPLKLPHTLKITQEEIDFGDQNQSKVALEGVRRVGKNHPCKIRVNAPSPVLIEELEKFLNA